MPDQLFVALDRSCQVPDSEMLAFGMSDMYRAWAVEVTLVVAFEVRDVRPVIYCHDFET